MSLFKTNLHLSDIFGVRYFATWYLERQLSGEVEGTLGIQ